MPLKAVHLSPTRAQWMGILTAHAEGIQARGARRRHRRFGAKASARLTLVSVTITFAESPVFFGDLLNASEEGIQIRTSKPIPLHSALRIELQFKDRYIALAGFGVHSTFRRGVYRTGVSLQFE